MIEIVDGTTLRISSSYGLKVPGAQPYSSEDAHYSFSVETPIDSVDSLDGLIEAAQDLAQALTNGVKLQAFAELDVAFEDKDGTLRPVLTVPDVPASAPRAGGRPASGATAPSAPRQQVDTSDRATITADLGFGSLTYLDNRPLKAAGKFKAGAADFRSKDKVAANGDKYHSVWIAQKGGEQNADVVTALSAAGITV
jgi:hypothetical protein